MALTNRYNGVVKGGLTVTGNTLSVSPNSAYPASLSIPYYTGAFISTLPSNQMTGYPPGTTTNGANSSSSAVLNIPSGSTVVFAQLCWVITGASNAAAAVTFVTPLRTVSITPTISDDSISGMPFRAADVTTIVNADGSGTYILGNTPVSTAPNGSNIISVNWTLLVIYSNSAFSYKYINVNTGAQNVSTTASANFTFSGFSTPSTGTVTGYFIATGTNGDLADLAKVKVGSTSANVTIGNGIIPWNGLSPYCITNNMFVNTILNADTNDSNFGLLDTRGSFGTLNANPFNSTMPAAARTLYDLIAVNISDKLVNNQTQLMTNVSVGSGGFVLNSESVQVSLYSADLGGTLLQTVDKTTANVGDTLTYTISFSNPGIINATNVFYSDTTPVGTMFLSNSLYIDGIQNLNTDIGPSYPVNFATVYPGDAHTITFKVVVNSIPSTNKITNFGSLRYSFVPAVGLATISDNVATNVVSTTVNYLRNPVLNSVMVTGTYTMDPSLPNGKAFYVDSNFVVADLNTATLPTSKTVNKDFAILGDILTYTISFKNTGNAFATNVVLIDTIPNGLSKLNNLIYLDGVSTTINIEPPGYNFGTISSGEAHTISYNVFVSTIPSPYGINNGATFNWSYTVNPSTPNDKTANNNSNIVTTTVNYPFINSTKYVDKTYVAWNDILTYTLVISNTGTTIANNVTVLDTIPSGTAYIAGTLTVNGTTSANPLTSIQVGNLNVNASATISYKAKVL